MNSLVRLGFALALLPAAACTPNPANPVASTIPQPPATSPTVSAADSSFALQAARSDLFEITSSQIALQKARTPAVRAYAQQMVDQHTQSTQDLNRLVAAKGISVPQPPGLEPVQQQAVGVLQDLSPGRAFERAYISGQITGHSATVQSYEQQIALGTDPELKAFAQRYLPHVQQHLDEARRLDNRRENRAARRDAS